MPSIDTVTGYETTLLEPLVVDGVRAIEATVPVSGHRHRLAAGYPVPRLGTPVEVADLICFAASEAAGYITGASFDINGGDLMM